MVRETERRLASAARYGRGWDGFTAEAPSRDAISDARRYLQFRPECEFKVDLEPDGSVNLVEGVGATRLIHAFEGNGVRVTSSKQWGHWEIVETVTL